MLEKKVYEIIYKKANRPEDLFWHLDEPHKFIVDAIKERGKPGRALDLGCGAGNFSIYLAKQGYDVTGLDFIPKALDMARDRASAAGVKVNWVQADLLNWKSPQQFDFVLDSGCLHTIVAKNMPRYKEQLLSWLAPKSDFVLVHFGKRHILDWRPIGPRRRAHQQILQFLSPELREKAYEEQLFAGIPLPVGPSVLGMGMWFQRT